MIQRGLPRRVYLRHGRYWYVRPSDGKWLPLSREKDGLPVMYIALARLLKSDVESELMPAVIARWLLQREEDDVWSSGHAADMKRITDGIAREFDQARPEQVTTKLVAAYLKPLRPKKRTHNQHRTALRQILAFAAAEGLRDGHNPVDDTEPMKQDKRVRVVTDDEIKALKEAAGQQSRNGEALVHMIDLAMITGQRIGDMIGLRWQDVTDDGLLVTQGKGAGAVKLLIEWSPALRAAVNACGDGRDRIGFLLKTQSGRGYRYAGIRSAWVRACERAGLEDLHIHDLRGRAGVDALGEDEDMRAAQRLLGHSGEAMTRHYVGGKYFRRVKPAR